MNKIIKIISKYYLKMKLRNMLMIKNEHHILKNIQKKLVKNIFENLKNISKSKKFEKLILKRWEEHRNNYVLKQVYRQWKANAKDFAYYRYIKINIIRKMDQYKKKTIIKAWKFQISESKRFHNLKKKADLWFMKTQFCKLKQVCSLSREHDKISK